MVRSSLEKRIEKLPGGAVVNEMMRQEAHAATCLEHLLHALDDIGDERCMFTPASCSVPIHEIDMTVDHLQRRRFFGPEY